MAAPRFYCPDLPPSGSALQLPRDAAHHAQRVLRLRVNDPVQVFDGRGCALNGKILEIDAKRVLVHEMQSCIADAESGLRIVLAQAMSSSDKMDWVVQKATELGAAEIHTVQTQRSVARLSGDRADKRAAHWQSVAISACEQCGRNTLPRIGPPQDFGAWLAAARGREATRFMLLPEGDSSLGRQEPPRGEVILLVGPEGGFDDSEIKMARLAGFLPVRMGSRILRTETAAIAGVTVLQTLWGDFK
jgi:16S rRNA (uracil1498-N3)-methyltransferase